MNSDSKPATQHFYLRLSNDGRTTKHGTPIPSEYLGAPVGVIAFRASENPGIVIVSGSMVSRKDMFVKKTGVAKAVGRLNNCDTRLSLTMDELRTTDVAVMATMLGLRSPTGNHFRKVDWSRANSTKASAVESFEARQAQVPA